MPFTVRSVFFIDPKNVVRAIISYPASCGRNFDEILRVCDSLQTSDANAVCTPAGKRFCCFNSLGWNVGDRIIIPPTVSTEKAIEKFGQENVRIIKPYLRTASLNPAKK